MSNHIDAAKDKISKKVLMSGDPLRVKYIAEKYLDNYELVNTTRNMLSYTGYYKNEKITVMAHGMGIPSAGIYSYELFNDYDVDVILRLGTCGSYDKDFNVLDLALVKESYSTSVYLKQLTGEEDNVISSNEEINEKIRDISSKKGIIIKEARVYSTDNFYTKEDITDLMREEYNCPLVEMETFAIFSNAKLLNKKASCILTVSDSFVTKDNLSSIEREKKLNEMIELGLDTIISL